MLQYMRDILKLLDSSMDSSSVNYDIKDLLDRSTISVEPLVIPVDLSITTLEQQNLNWLNNLRVQHGARRLRMNNKLLIAARKHSALMAAKNQMSHDLGGTLPQRLAAVGYKWSWAGENIAYNYGYSNPWQTLFEQWKNSPEHLANMLNTEFTEVGLGFSVNGNYSWGTQDFGKPALQGNI